MVPGVQVHDCSVGQTCSSGQDQAGMLNGERGLRAVKIGSLRFLVINFGGLVLEGFIYLSNSLSKQYMYVVIYDFRCTFEL